MTAVINVFEAPVRRRALDKVEWVALPYAFFRSTKATYSLPPGLLRYFWIKAFGLKMWSVLRYLFLKPACDSTGLSFIQLRYTICCSTCFGGTHYQRSAKLFLHNYRSDPYRFFISGTINALDHIVGYAPVFMKRLIREWFHKRNFSIHHTSDYFCHNFVCPTCFF